jgi:hypothetical protein
MLGILFSLSKFLNKRTLTKGSQNKRINGGIVGLVTNIVDNVVAD